MGIVSAIVDSREPAYIQGLTFGGVATSIMALEAADLLCVCSDSTVLAVERKTSNDLLHTISDDRFFPQMAGLREVSPWCYVVVCGDLRPGPGGKTFCNGRESGFNWWSIQGALLTAQEMGIAIVTIGAETEYEQTIIRLASRERAAVRIRQPRDVTITSQGEQILASLPGIGAEKAHALLEYAGTPAWALAYLTDDEWIGPTAPGVGDGIKRRVRSALGLEDWAILHPMMRDGKAAEKQEQVA